ncbi:MAG: HlyD family efflux transporter periplasmic adaptor subunit [Candidatus Brocadiia bacterium]
MARNRTRTEPEHAVEPLVGVAVDEETAESPLGVGQAAPAARRRRNPLPLLLALLVVAGGGAFGWWWWFGRETATETERATFTVRRADLPIDITESGGLEALRSKVYKSEVEGTTTVIYIVEEGTRITEQDVADKKVLVRLDSSKIRDQLEQQEITFASAKASYEDAEEAYDIQKSEGESEVKQAELDVKFSRMDLEHYVGEALAADALEGEVDLARLADELYRAALQHRKAIEGEVQVTLEEADHALAATHNPAGEEANPGPAPHTTEEPVFEAPEKPQPKAPETAARLGGSALQNKRTLEANIGLAIEEFKIAADDVIGAADLLRLKAISRKKLEAYELALKRRRIELDQALMARELFFRYEFPKQAQQYLSLYQEEVRELERVKARARSALVQADVKRQSAKATYLLQKSRLEKLQAQLAACTIVATQPGLVVYATTGGHWRHSGDPIEEGSTIRERQEIIKLPDIASLAVGIRVHESLVEKVKVGLPARVRVDAFPEMNITGKVYEVADLPSSRNRWLNPDLKEYETIVAIDGVHPVLKPGMSAEVTVHVKTLRNVLHVPVQAVTARGDRSVVYVVHEDGTEEERAVEIGESNDDFVEIRSGLAEGEKVLLEAPRYIATEEEEEKAPQAEDQEAEEAEEPGQGPQPRQEEKGKRPKEGNARPKGAKGSPRRGSSRSTKSP